MTVFGSVIGWAGLASPPKQVKQFSNLNQIVSKKMTASLAAISDMTAPVIPEAWVYGWTHYGLTGQTRARMNKLTREVEMSELNQWIKCRPGCDEFFTPAMI